MRYKLLTLILCISLLILSGCYTIKIERPNSEAIPPSSMRSSAFSDSNNYNNTNNNVNNNQTENKINTIKKQCDEFESKNINLERANQLIKLSYESRDIEVSKQAALNSIAITNYLIAKKLLENK